MLCRTAPLFRNSSDNLCLASKLYDPRSSVLKSLMPEAVFPHMTPYGKDAALLDRLVEIGMTNTVNLQVRNLQSFMQTSLYISLAGLSRNQEFSSSNLPINKHWWNMLWDTRPMNNNKILPSIDCVIIVSVKRLNTIFDNQCTNTFVLPATHTL